MRARADLFPGAANGRQPVTVPVAVSLICHLLIFGLIVSSPIHLSGRRTGPRIVNVSLVALPRIQSAPAPAKAPAAKASASRAAKPAPKPPAKPAVSEKAQVTVKKSVSEKKPAATVSTAPTKWSEKTSLKKETFKPEQAVKQAIKKIEEQTADARPSSVAAAIEQLRGKVAKESEKRALERAPADESVPGEGESGGVVRTAAEILVYQQEIAYHIRNNWVYPEQLADQQPDLEARVMIKIMADGEIDDVRFEKRSGSRYLDESAYKAVLKSNPLPPLPRGYRDYTVILGFTPEGLR